MGFFPYLFFSGNCREAMTRYHEIFGGEIFVMRMGDAPDTGDLPPEKADLVIHAALMLDGGFQDPPARLLLAAVAPGSGLTGHSV